MKKLPIDLPLRSVSTKVSVAAWERAQFLKDQLGCRLSDVVSAALLYIDNATLEKVMADQKAAIDALPKPIRTLLKDLDSLSPEDRAALKDLLD